MYEKYLKLYIFSEKINIYMFEIVVLLFPRNFFCIIFLFFKKKCVSLR